MAAAVSLLHLDLGSPFPEHILTVGKIRFGEKEREGKITEDVQKKIREQIKEKTPGKSNKEVDTDIRRIKEELKVELDIGKKTLSRATCTLLNSGGGIIKAEIKNEGYSFKEHRIGLDIVQSFREIIQQKEFSDYFDFKQQGPSMLIFIKTWSSGDQRYARLCSLETGLYERAESSAVKRNPLNAVDFLRRRKKANPKRGCREEGEPAAKYSRTNRQSSAEEDIDEAAAQFFKRERLEHGETLKFVESTEVEFKQFPVDEDILGFVKRMLPRYVSAFASGKGGYLIFGVNDNKIVLGHNKNVKPSLLEKETESIIHNLPHIHFCTSEKNVVFKCKVLPVFKEDEPHGFVLAVRIESFCCAVFIDEPDSWIIENGKVKRLPAKQWCDLMLAEDPDLDELAGCFQTDLNICDKPPLTKTVYSIKAFAHLKGLQDALFPESSDRVAFIPQSLCNELFSENPKLKDLIKSNIPPLAQGTLMFSRSWTVDVGLPKNQAIVCDALLIAAGSHIYLFTVLESPSSEAYGHAKRTARLLKHKLVNVGGYSEKICVIPRILCLSDDASSENTPKYPKTYMLKQEHLPSLQKSLIIVLFSFTSFLSDQVGVAFLNLLTLEQYKKLSENLQKTQRQFIYGMPGSGKTIVALKIMEKIKNAFNCQPHEILYICENTPLRNFVQKKMPQTSVVTRATFMRDDFMRYYHSVKHIIVDEAQNFRTENGSWYGKALRIVSQNRTSPGIFRIFLDYWQLSHTFQSGLPPLEDQDSRDHLTAGVRNAVEIYKEIHEKMGKVVENKALDIPHDQLKELLSKTRCSHSVAGFCETKAGLERKELARYVAGQCKRYLEKGYSRKDIAILCGTENAAECLRGWLVMEMRRSRLDSEFVKADEVLVDKIVLDSIRRFSGLERPIVFGIHPVPAQQQVSDNLLLCVASRANLRLHILYDSSFGEREPHLEPSTEP